MQGNIGRHTLQNLFNVGAETGETDIDISAAVYTAFVDLLTVEAPVGGLQDCRIDIDVNKTTTGWDTVATAADTIDACLVLMVDDTNYRLLQNGTQITANGDGSLEMSENGFSFKTGPLASGETVKVKVKLSAERGDCVLPYKVTYVGKAPTITAVAAG
jgi:hypothetical protein